MSLPVEFMPLHGTTVPVLRFGSFQDAITAAESPYDVTQCSGASRKERAKESWDLGWGFTKSLKLAREGWPEGHASVARFAERLDVSGRVAKPDIIYDVTGNCGIDMGRVMQGEPECFMEWEETDIPLDAKAGGKIVHIVFNFSASYNVKSDVLTRRGAACMAVIDALETAGKRVELTAHLTCTQYHIEIPLKTPESHAQVDQIAFAMVAPAMLRRIGFSLIAQCGDAGREAAADGGYGTPSNLPTGDIYFPSAYGYVPEWESDAAAITWIERILREQGIELSIG